MLLGATSSPHPTLVLETGSLTGLKFAIGSAGWPVSSRGPLVSLSPVLGLLVQTAVSGFYGRFWGPNSAVHPSRL